MVSSLVYVRDSAYCCTRQHSSANFTQDLDDIEEWNEFGELKENIGDVPANNAASAGNVQGVNIRPAEPAKPKAMPGNVVQQGINKAPPPILDDSKRRPLPGAAEIAAKNKQPISNPIDEPLKAETMTTAPAEKKESINAAKEIAKQHPSLDHLSAPASRIQSGTATPQSEPAIAAIEEPAGESAKVQDAPEDIVNDPDKKIAVREQDEEGDSAAKGVEGLQVADGRKTQEQDAKEGEDASISVED